MIQNRTLAKIVYRIGGLIRLIRTPQKVYQLEFDGGLYDRIYVGRRWLPSRLSMKMLILSTRLDTEHWDHWALVHDQCGGEYCLECHGRVC